MSKKSKARAKDQRLKEKRGRKAAMAAQYEAWSREGKNKKSKRNRLVAGRVRLVRDVDHPDGPCGNIGCLKCNGNSRANNPFLAPVNSCIYAKQFSSPKWRNAA
jgi:hypothetical protein